jgi:hypothetical protein
VALPDTASRHIRLLRRGNCQRPDRDCGHPARHRQISPTERVLKRPTLPSWAPWPEELELGETRLYIASGWPFRCLTAQCTEFDPRWTVPQSQPPTRWRNSLEPEWLDALVLRDQSVGGPFSAWVIPCRILWLRALANAMIVGVLLFVAWSTLARLRERLRRPPTDG